MNRYITEVHVKELFHLNDFSIKIDKDNPHLIITGKNGSGKTVLLSAISDFLDKIKDDEDLSFLQVQKWVENAKKHLENTKNSIEKAQAEYQLKGWRKMYENLFGKVEIKFDEVANIIKLYQEGDFIMAFYKAHRIIDLVQPKNPTKPNIPQKTPLTKSTTKEFLNYLVDLKVQRALALSEKNNTYANEIAEWFNSFETLLENIYHDSKLRLEFNIKTYEFFVNTGGKRFRFTELSDGYAAILDIIADLILKMQNSGSITRAFNKKGIVLIDEIETHLHLELQKEALPMLTTLFPNVQFIVTTHSPFVLNSSDATVAFDLEHRETIADLNEYSYDVLAEGYFGVTTESGYMYQQLERLEGLLNSDKKSDADITTIKNLMSDFDKIPATVFPTYVKGYRDLKIKYASTIKTL